MSASGTSREGGERGDKSLAQCKQWYILMVEIIKGQKEKSSGDVVLCTNIGAKS